MNVFRVLLVVAFLLGSHQLWSQDYNFDPNYEADILRFSSHNYSGSARYMATGGAFSSVGADMSNLSYNPAGIGMYRNTLAQISLGVNYAKFKSNYLSTDNTDSKVSASVPSVGLVFASTKPSKNGLFRSAAFGIALNRLGDYNTSEKISGFSTFAGSSRSWSWANEMSDVYNGAFTNETSVENVSFNTFTGFYGYLANFDSVILDYSSPVVDSFQQTRYTDSKGSKNEIVISAGTNYIDKLYFGASIGIPFANYSRESRWIEDDVNDAMVNSFFNSFELKETYKTEGIGVNFKVGAIYKISKLFRIGAGFQTPERMNFTERYSSVLNSDLDFGNYEVESGEGVFEYRTRLPWRANFGGSIFFNKSGFFSVDYEAVGYNSMRYNFGNDYQEISDAYNTSIKAKYQVGHNVRVGFEGVIDKLRIRLGYNFSGSPIKNSYRETQYDFSRHTISGGFGFLFDKIAIDFAYQHNLSGQYEQPYLIDNATVSGIAKNINQGMSVVSIAYKLK